MERADIFEVCTISKHDLLMRAIVFEVLAERKQLPCARCNKISEYTMGYYGFLSTRMSYGNYN